MQTIQIEKYIAQNTQYNLLWEVGLAVLTHQGFSQLFELINSTLDSNDAGKISELLNLVSKMASDDQQALCNGLPDPDQGRMAVERLEIQCKNNGLMH